jgi:hypothetical protein
MNLSLHELDQLLAAERDDEIRHEVTGGMRAIALLFVVVPALVGLLALIAVKLLS